MGREKGCRDSSYFYDVITEQLDRRQRDISKLAKKVSANENLLGLSDLQCSIPWSSGTAMKTLSVVLLTLLN